MAIEIIPKPKIIKIPWLNIIYFICLIGLLVSLIGYLVLYQFQKKLTKELSDIERTLVRTPEEERLEKEVLDWRDKISSFALLLNLHKLPTKLFDLLEETTHPKVWFTKFDLNLEKKELSISGKTQSFETLGQQTIIFEKEELIRTTNLAKVSISKEGEAEFTFLLTFDPQIFK